MSPLQKWSTIITCCLLLMLTLPLNFILLVGMLPTITVLVTDAKNTDKLLIVGCFNLAGVLIYMLELMNNFSLFHAFMIIRNIFNLVVMYSSAAIGFIIYSELPNLFLFFSRISAKRQLETIERKLNLLTEEWGSDILNNPIPEKLSKK